MKRRYKRSALLLALIFVLSLGTGVLADGANGTGQTADTGTITVTNAKVGETYRVYLIFPATVDGEGHIAYTSAAQLPENDFFARDAETGTVTALPAASDESGNLSSGAVAFLAGLKGDAADTQTARSGAVVFSGLQFGYYYIESSLGSAVTVDSTNPDARVIEKNTDAGIEKVILTETADGTVSASRSSAGLGERVTFQITVPLYHYLGTDMIDCYYVFDRMNGALTWDGSLSAALNGVPFAGYTVTREGLSQEYRFRVDVPIRDGETGEFLYGNNDVLTLTYSAVVNETLAPGAAMDNTAVLDWSTVPPVPPETPPVPPTEPTGERPSRTTETYSAEIELHKTDETGRLLTGAKFRLSGLSSPAVLVNDVMFAEDSEHGDWWMLKDGSYTQTPPTAEGTDPGAYDDPARRYVKLETVAQVLQEGVPVETEAYVQPDGTLRFTGLGEGSYTIRELIAPDGYNLLKEALTVTVRFDPATGTFTAETEGQEVTDGTVTVQVVNRAGRELPSTGGMGTTLLLAVGAAGFLMASVVLITKKRLDNGE